MDGAAFARAWREWPEIAAFSGAMASAGHERAAEAAVHALLADTGWVERLVAALSATARADPGFAAPFAPLADPLQQGFVLIDDDKVTLALSVVGLDALAARKAAAGGAGSIGFDGGLALYRLLDAGDATIGWWAAPRIDDAFDAGMAPRCRRIGEERLADGGWLRVDGRERAFIVEHAERDLVMLQGIVKLGRAPLRIEYDAESGGFVGASATDPAASQAQMLMTLLRHTGGDGAAAEVERWTRHPAFFLRWHAARILLALDRDEGRAAVARLAEDPHRDVRDAARAALARWERRLCHA